MNQARLLRLGRALDLLGNLRDLGQADKELAGEVGQLLVSLMQRDNLQQVSLKEFPVAKRQADVRFETAILRKVAIDIFEALFAVVVLDEDAVAVELFHLANALYGEQKVGLDAVLHPIKLLLL